MERCLFSESCMELGLSSSVYLGRAECPLRMYILIFMSECLIPARAVRIERSHRSRRIREGNI
jgi:hypothetical protein